MIQTWHNFEDVTNQIAINLLNYLKYYLHLKIKKLAFKTKSEKKYFYNLKKQSFRLQKG